MKHLVEKYQKLEIQFNVNAELIIHLKADIQKYHAELECKDEELHTYSLKVNAMWSHINLIMRENEKIL